MILTHWLLQWDINSFMTTHRNYGFKSDFSQKMQSVILVLIRHVKILVHQSVCNRLPAFRALTGCDYRALIRKVKVAPFKLLENSTEAKEVFTEMNTETLLNSSILEKWRSTYACYTERRNAIQ